MVKNRRKIILSILSVIVILIMIGNIVLAATSSELKEQQKQKQAIQINVSFNTLILIFAIVSSFLYE